MIEVDVAQQYRSTMDSVDLLNGDKPVDWTDEQWIECVERNKEHIRIMLAKDFWTEEYDLTPFNEVLAETPVTVTKAK